MHYFLSLLNLVGCWSLISIRFIYTFVNVCPFDYTAFAINWKVGYPLPVKLHQLNDCCYSNCQSYVCLQLLCNRSISWRFCDVIFFKFSVGIRVFVIGLSDLLLIRFTNRKAHYVPV